MFFNVPVKDNEDSEQFKERKLTLPVVEKKSRKNLKKLSDTEQKFKVVKADNPIPIEDQIL